MNMGELFQFDLIGSQEMNRLEMTESEMEKSGLIDGDLLFGRRSLVEAGAGKCSLVRDLMEPATFESSIIRVRTDQTKVNSHFLFYWFKSPMGKGAIRSIVTGTNVKGIRGSVLERISVPCPKRSTQDRCTALLRQYDDLIENNRRRISLLEQAARLLYEEWFVRCRFPGHGHAKFINGLPDGWTRVPLGDVLTLKRGYDLPSSTRVDGEVPVVSSSGITGYHNQVQAKAPGIVTGRYGTLGQVYFVQRDFWPLNTALYVSDFRGLQPEFALHLLRNVLASWQSDKAAVPGIDRKVLHKFPVIVPPESLRLLFSSFASSVYKQIFTLENASVKLENARNLLLPRLMSGEVKV